MGIAASNLLAKCQKVKLASSGDSIFRAGSGAKRGRGQIYERLIEIGKITY
jgi:hypothetical protein